MDLIVICPYNPFIRIEPILAIPGLHDALRHTGAPAVAVSPTIGGQSIKGPTAKMFRELGIVPSAQAVADRCAGLVDVLVADPIDAGVVVLAGMRLVVEPALMSDLPDRERLARAVLRCAA